MNAAPQNGKRVVTMNNSILRHRFCNVGRAIGRIAVIFALVCQVLMLATPALALHIMAILQPMLPIRRATSIQRRPPQSSSRRPQLRRHRRCGTIATPPKGITPMSRHVTLLGDKSRLRLRQGGHQAAADSPSKILTLFWLMFCRHNYLQNSSPKKELE